MILKFGHAVFYINGQQFDAAAALSFNQHVIDFLPRCVVGSDDYPFVARQLHDSVHFHFRGCRQARSLPGQQQRDQTPEPDKFVMTHFHGDVKKPARVLLRAGHSFDVTKLRSNRTANSGTADIHVTEANRDLCGTS